MPQKGGKVYELIHMNAVVRSANRLRLSLATASRKFDGVNMLNNFEFSCDIATVWRAFDVDKGKHIRKYWPNFFTGLNHCKCRMLHEKEVTKQS